MPFDPLTYVRAAAAEDAVDRVRRGVGQLSDADAAFKAALSDALYVLQVLRATAAFTAPDAIHETPDGARARADWHAQFRDDLRRLVAGLPDADPPAVSAAKHTPGPWTVTRTRHRTILVACSGDRVGECESLSSADAVLIAAAPDLLAALRTLVEACDTRPFYAQPHGALADARTTIAKAEGRS